MIPEGPLHAADFGIALLLGAAVAVIFWRSRWWLPAASLVGLGGFGRRHGWRNLVDGLIDRPNFVFALTALVVVGTIGWQLDRRVAVSDTMVPMLTTGALATVWLVVPDTEAPLMFGATLIVAMVACPRRESSASSAVPGGAVLGLAVVAACVGTIGRPDRLLAAVVAIGLSTLVALGMTLAARSFSERGVLGRRPTSARV